MEDTFVEQGSSEHEETCTQGQLAGNNTDRSGDSSNSSKPHISNDKANESMLFTRNVGSSQDKEDKSDTSYSLFKKERYVGNKKFRSSEDLRKKAENINVRIRLLQSQLAAKEAALESRKEYLAQREQLAANSIPVSWEAKKTFKVEPREPLPVTINRIQTENSLRVSESHKILDCSIGSESLTNIYKQLQDGSLEIAQGGDVQSHVESYIQREKESQLEKIRTLREQYFTLKDAWIERIRKMDRLRSKEGNSSCRERDVWLMRAIRGVDHVKVPRNRGPGSSPSTGSSSEEGDTRVEGENGKQANATVEGFQSLTAAVIPGQIGQFEPFEGGNVLYENPIEESYFDSLVNPWTRAERIIFLKKFLQYGKNFRKIATFLEYKTTEDVVRYYFRNKLKLNLKLLAREYMGTRQQSWKASSAILACSGFPADSVTRRWILDNFKGVKKPPEQSDSTAVDSSVSAYQRRDTNTPQTLSNMIGRNFETQGKRVLREFGLQSIIQQTPSFRNSIVCHSVGRDGLIVPYYLIEKMKMKRQLENLIAQRRSGAWTVEGKKGKVDVKKYHWTAKEKNTFFRLVKELGCDWEKIAEQIPTKSPLQLRAFYDEYMSQRGAEASEGDSTIPNSSPVGSDGEVSVYSKSLRKRKESQESATRKRFRRMDSDAVCKEDPDDASSVFYQQITSISQEWKTENYFSADNGLQSFEKDISKDSGVANDVNTEQDTDRSDSVGRRTLHVHDLLSQ